MEHLDSRTSWQTLPSPVRTYSALMGLALAACDARSLGLAGGPRVGQPVRTTTSSTWSQVPADTPKGRGYRMNWTGASLGSGQSPSSNKSDPNKQEPARRRDTGRESVLWARGC